MPQLPDLTNEIKTVVLPSTKDLPETEQVKVTIRTGEALGADMEEASSFNAGGVLFGMIASRIVEWNYTQPDGTPTPITVDNVRRVKYADLIFLMGEFNLKNDKKESTLADPKENVPSSVI